MATRKKLNSIELFAGCGGIVDGFEQSGEYTLLGAVEWEKAPCDNLIHRLKDRWKVKDADRRVLRFDIQRTDELLGGWQGDAEYGSSEGLDVLVGDRKVDVIAGGPPCQSYSLAGRWQSDGATKYDYRNFLFDSYLKVVKHYKPKAFVFENVPGLLSAKIEGNVPVVGLIREAFREAGYLVLDDLSEAVIDMTEYGVPQSRDRVIILGLSLEEYGGKAKDMLKRFYAELLPKHKVSKKATVRDAIGDLPKLYPLKKAERYEGKRITYSLPNPFVPNHIARCHSERDMGVFRMLAEDAEKGGNRYASSEARKRLYAEVTGRTSNFHKYNILRWDRQSSLIFAHLYKDGLHHIHPDPGQMRSITPREAARLQTFPDDYIFYGSHTSVYKMIGNAVPPLFAKKLSLAVYELLTGKGK